MEELIEMNRNLQADLRAQRELVNILREHIVLIEQRKQEDQPCRKEVEIEIEKKKEEILPTIEIIMDSNRKQVMKALKKTAKAHNNRIRPGIYNE